MKTHTRPRSRRGEGDALRDEILDAAERLIVRAGDADAVSIRAIADAVGVSPPAIYLHFPDKDALVSAVCERRFEEFDATHRGRRRHHRRPGREPAPPRAAPTSSSGSSTPRRTGCSS